MPDDADSAPLTRTLDDNRSGWPTAALSERRHSTHAACRGRSPARRNRAGKRTPAREGPAV